MPGPCDGVGRVGRFEIAPGSSWTPVAIVCAGIVNCAGGLGISLGGSGSSFGGFAAGTVIFSFPGSSAFRTGSGLLLPPPPPPPPGPFISSQTISVGIWNGCFAAGGAAGKLMMKRNSSTMPTWVASETLRAPPNRCAPVSLPGIWPVRNRALGLAPWKAAIGDCETGEAKAIVADAAGMRKVQ